MAEMLSIGGQARESIEEILAYQVLERMAFSFERYFKSNAILGSQSNEPLQ